MDVSNTQLRQAAAALDLKTKDMAADIGVGPNYLTQVLKGHKVPSSMLAKSLKRYLEQKGVHFKEDGGIEWVGMKKPE